jgi:hypothetical protein
VLDASDSLPRKNAFLPSVTEALRAHGLEPSDTDSAASLRERLNDLYLDEVRRLRDRQRSGEIAKPDYAGHVAALRDRFPLLGLPTERWTE